MVLKGDVMPVAAQLTLLAAHPSVCSMSKQPTHVAVLGLPAPISGLGQSDDLGFAEYIFLRQEMS